MKKVLTPRWIVGHLIALALVGLFVSLGFWQLRRLHQREAYNVFLGARLTAEPQPFAQLLERFSLDAPVDAEDSAFYRRARVTGSFDAENEILLRSRAFNGQPGYHVLTPLQLGSGRALLVDRGWVPFELDTPPIPQAAPPAAPLTLTGILQPVQRPLEGGLMNRLGLVQRDPAEGKLEAVFYVDPSRIERQLPYRLEPVFLELQSQSPAQPGRLPVPPEAPDLTQGSHLSYALQWFSFALIGIIGYVTLMRSVVREKPKTVKRGRLGNA